MYPLKVVVVGDDEQTLPHIRRELLNLSAELEAEYPDAQTAIHALRRTSGGKRLILYHLQDSAGVDMLGRLTAAYPGWPLAALIPSDEPSGTQTNLLFSAMRAGAAQIVSLPLSPSDFEQVLERIAAQFAYADRDKKVIAVAGVTGGCGATTLAINLAHEIAAIHELRCVLVDLSLKLGVIAIHLNLEPPHSIVDLLRDVTRVDSLLLQKVLAKVTDRFAILPGPNHLVGGLNATSDDIASIVDGLAQVSDVIVLDVPSTYDELYFDTVSRADHAILVGEQKLTSVRALKLVSDSLSPSHYRRDHLVVNRYDPKNRDFAIDRLLKPLGVANISVVARDDDALRIAHDRGSALSQCAPRSQVLGDVRSLAEHVLERQPASPSKSSNFLGRLARVFSHS